ncbi:MAG: hypothetical protein ACI8QZ_000328 [Chlamydiales bacterium]|jgi:hypothetical protein
MSTAPDDPADERSHFLPVSLELLLEDLLKTVVGASERAGFERLGKLWLALFHLRMRADLEGLRRTYAPFDPDVELLVPDREIDRPAARTELEGRLRTLLGRAHFTEATRADLDSALTKISPQGLAVTVDLDELDLFALYFRGVSSRSSRQRDPRALWLRWREHEETIYRRVVLLIEVKPSGEGETGMDARHVYLKLFKDVPRSDLEMLLPNTKVCMRAFDKLRLGVTGGGGTIGGVMATVTKIGVAASPVTWALALAGLGAVLWRQLSNVLSQRTKYMATLAQRLYFHTLDNGFGVLTRLVQVAEEEECKEVLLAAAHLVQGGAMSAEELDARAEAWIESTYGLHVDYDVHGGVQKLRQAGLLVAVVDSDDSDEQAVQLLPLEQARCLLDQRWDAVFDWKQPPE